MVFLVELVYSGNFIFFISVVPKGLFPPSKFSCNGTSFCHIALHFTKVSSRIKNLIQFRPSNYRFDLELFDLAPVEQAYSS